jgi:hypothetical protein
MKKILTAVILLAAGCISANAQIKFTFSKGMKANAVMSGYLWREGQNAGSLNAGFSFGTVDRLDIGEHFTLQGELLFHNGTNTLQNRAIDVQEQYKYWRMEVPTYMIVKLRVGTGKMFFGIGPYVAVGLSAKRNPGNINLYGKDEQTGERPMNRWNTGGSATFGYEWTNGLFVDMAYHAGFADGWMPWTANSSSAAKGHQNLSLGIGYRFRLFGIQLDKNKIRMSR